MAIIKVENVTYNYTEGGLAALNGVSLEINKGEIIGIVGHNGCGKSTLAKHLNGLLIPSSGKVLVCDMDTADESNSFNIKRHVGIVFQNPDNQIVTTIVEDDVAFGPENLGVEPGEIRKRVDEALLSVGMSNYSLAAPHMLSGGQKQRIAIAGMLAMKPDVLVLDEATAMLDPKGRHEIMGIARRLNREQGMTIVMITQYMDEVTDVDRVVVMKRGRIDAMGTPKEIFAHADLKGAGIDVPPAVKLKNELIEAGALVETDVVRTEEIIDAIYKEYVRRGVMK